MDEIIKLLAENLAYIVHKVIVDTIFINLVLTREIVIGTYCGNHSSKVYSSDFNYTNFV